MHTRMFRSICLAFLAAVMLVGGFPSTAVKAAYQPVSSVTLTVGSSTMTVNGFSFPVDPANPKVTPIVEAAWDRALVPIRNVVELT
ncbi:MAG: hypothetical protein ACPL2N_04825, partial [Candidatus Cryosericum sp.]